MIGYVMVGTNNLARATKLYDHYRRLPRELPNLLGKRRSLKTKMKSLV